MNLVAIIGNVVADPELRHTSNGKAVCSFRIAVSRPGGDEADFFKVTTWEKTADVVADYVTKGRRVAIEGRLRQETWETDGAKRSSVEIVATRVTLLGRRPGDGDADTDTPSTDDDSVV